MFTDPNGNNTVVNGFYFEDFNLQHDNTKHHPHWIFLAHEYVTGKNIKKWKMRFSPTKTGVYNYSVKVVLPLENQSFNVMSGSFTCINGDDNNGFIS